MDIEKYINNQMGWDTSELKVGDWVQWLDGDHYVQTVIERLDGSMALLDGCEVGGAYLMPICRLERINKP